MESNYSLGDIAAVTRDAGDFGGNSAWWIIVLFLFWGMNGSGFNRGGEQVATNGDVQRGFDTNNIIRKLDGINSGLCDGFYAQNTTMLNGFNTIGSQIAENRFAQQQCCCETNRNIDSVKYENAQNTCAIMQNDSKNTQKILDAITGNRMADMQNQINQLQLQSALCGVVRYPNATTYTAGYSPCFTNNSCSNGCGCY